MLAHNQPGGMAGNRRPHADPWLERQPYLAKGQALRAQALRQATNSAGGFVWRSLRDHVILPFTRYRDRRRAVQQLLSLDDHLLRDIGLTRDMVRIPVSGLLDLGTKKETVVLSRADRLRDRFSVISSAPGDGRTERHKAPEAGTSDRPIAA